MSPITDESLLARIVIGDDEALLEIYDRYASRVYALILRILSDPMSAEDVTQDVFLKLKARARTFSAVRGTLAHWLLTIARNAALDKLRFERHRPGLADDDDPEELWPILADANTTSDEARWRSLYFALQNLVPEQRKVIELAYYQGMSHSEIAEYLNCPLGTVKTRLRMGMEQLRIVWFADAIPTGKTEMSTADV
jgi:RNA polymerase sigma-70 factor (ECF subfamily)